MKCILPQKHPLVPYLDFCGFTPDDIGEVIVRHYPDFDFDLSETNNQFLDAIYFFKQCIVRHIAGIEWKELLGTSEETLNNLLLNVARAISQFDQDRLWEERLLALTKWLER